MKCWAFCSKFLCHIIFFTRQNLTYTFRSLLYSYQSWQNERWSKHVSIFIYLTCQYYSDSKFKWFACQYDEARKFLRYVAAVSSYVQSHDSSTAAGILNHCQLKIMKILRWKNDSALLSWFNFFIPSSTFFETYLMRNFGNTCNRYLYL